MRQRAAVAFALHLHRKARCRSLADLHQDIGRAVAEAAVDLDGCLQRRGRQAVLGQLDGEITDAVQRTGVFR